MSQIPIHWDTFYLGTHKVAWLERAGVPLFLSYSTLRDRVELPRAIERWAMDSGGFTQLSQHGRWTISPYEYARSVRRYRDEIGMLDWAAIQDWMVEPRIRAATGLTVAEHQCLTIRSYLDLMSIDPDLPWTPVLQGWTFDDYLQHIELYARFGVDLASLPVVGVGSVCRRQNTGLLRQVLIAIRQAGVERLHGFGIKLDGLVVDAPLLKSADSLAWSKTAMHEPPLPGHTHEHCNNCLEYALLWREKVLEAIDEGMRADVWGIGAGLSPTLRA